ncbi:unnamed protein product [Vicia faba]|uniref:Uncharacterized protein n=1 Tax=Vicia faba TaxID=3906 RepID=A0AAV0Z8Y4_VICFA|nr:unnamed protein product [Vicia faba]
MDASSSEGMVTEISDYHLTHDKVRRVIVASERDNYASLGYYVLNVAEGLKPPRSKGKYDYPGATTRVEEPVSTDGAEVHVGTDDAKVQASTDGTCIDGVEVHACTDGAEIHASTNGAGIDAWNDPKIDVLVEDMIASFRINLLRNNNMMSLIHQMSRKNLQE